MIYFNYSGPLSLGAVLLRGFFAILLGFFDDAFNVLWNSSGIRAVVVNDRGESGEGFIKDSFGLLQFFTKNSSEVYDGFLCDFFAHFLSISKDSLRDFPSCCFDGRSFCFPFRNLVINYVHI